MIKFFKNVAYQIKKQRRFVLLFIILLLGFSSHVPAQDKLSQTPIDQITKRFQQGKVFNASFEHILIDSFTQDTTRQSGKIWVAENKYKVNTEAQILLVDGSVSKAFDQFKSRLIISKYDPQDDDFAPSKILNGLDSTYTVNRNVKEGDYYVVQLGTDDPFATFTFVEVVTNQNYVPISITAIDQTDNEYTTRFQRGRFTEVKPEMFTLDVPDNTETVDLRNQ